MIIKWAIAGSDDAPDHPEYHLVYRQGAEDGEPLNQEQYDDLRERLGLKGVDARSRISNAVLTALDWAFTDNPRTLHWVIDQMLEDLLDEDEYRDLIFEACHTPLGDKPDYREWDRGEAP